MMQPQSPDVLVVPANKDFNSALDDKVRIVYEEHEDNFPVKKSTKHHKKNRRPSHHKQKSPLKHSKLCLSEFIAPVRLTRRVGLFNHGKKSNTVSRLQFGVSAETKARSNQDLLEVLNLANTCTQTDQDMHTCQKRKLTLLKGNIQTCSGDESDHSPYKCIHNPVEKCCTSSFIGLRAEDCKKHLSSYSESKLLHSAGNSTPSSTNVKLRHPEEVHASSGDNTYVNSIMARLHRTLSKKHKEVFPHICMGRKLRKDLLSAQSNLKLLKKTCNPDISNSSSSKYSTVAMSKITASQKVTDSCIAQSLDQGDKASPAASFQLNLCPDLLQKPSTQSQWRNFPSSKVTKDIFVSTREKALLEEELRIFHSDDTNIKIPVLLSPRSEARQSSTSLTCASPDSDGVPAWRPQSSPFKLPPKSPSTPWHYLRRKMY